MADVLTANIPSIVNIVAVILIIVCGLGLLFLIVRAVYLWKRYNIPVEVIEKDTSTGVPVHEKDKGGIFFDRETGMRLFFLKKHKVGLKPDNIPFVRTPKGKKVFVYRYGFRNFSFMRPSIDNPEMVFSVGDEDISWALLAYERGNKVFVNTMLGQLMQMMPYIIGGVILIIMMVYMFKSIPYLKELTVELRGLAAEMAKARAGTVVIGG